MINPIYKHILYFIVVNFYLLNSSIAQNFGFDIINNRKKIEIPFEIYNNLIVVPVFFEQTIPMKFIVDSGVRHIILTEKTYGDLLELKYSRKISIRGAGDKQDVEAYVASNVSLNLPGVVGRGLTLLTLEEDYLNLRGYLGAEVHGIIGYDLFSRFIVKVDYVNKIMTLYEHSKFKPPKRYTSLPLQIHNGKPYIETNMTLEDDLKFVSSTLIDTGASHALQIEANGNSDITPPKKHLKSQLGIGLGGEITGSLGRIPALSVAGFNFKNIICSFPDTSSYDLQEEIPNRHGTLGGEVLSRFFLIFDYFNNQLYLKKNNAYSRAFHYNKSGLTVAVEYASLHKFRITKIRAGSAAEQAGIKTGDIILKINGFDGNELDLNKVNQFFVRRDGATLRFLLDRNGEILKKKIQLKSLI